MFGNLGSPIPTSIPQRAVTQVEPTLLCEDNKAAIIVAEVEMSSAGRSKHIDVRFKHVAQSIREGVARVRYVSTKWNYADLMTKPLAKLKVKRSNFFFEESWLM